MMSGEGGQPPLTLYLHIPYCRRKCRYCDFHSRAMAPVPGYARAVLRELDFWRQRLAGDARPLHSVYIGGGTPSLMPPGDIKQILDHIRGAWSLIPGAEITLEANPESVAPASLDGYAMAGVNRLSLGVQAMDDVRLRWLGRPHDVARAERAAGWVRALFPRFSLDLIYATPGQTVAAWRRELDHALAWGAGHLSCYALTLEPATPLGRRQRRGSLAPLEEELERELFQVTRGHLARAGLPAYEISNFSRPGEESRHNLNYWNFGDYLGVGAASHGKITGADGRVWRSVNLVDEGRYRERLEQGRPPWWRHRVASLEELATERLIMALRTSAGLELAGYHRATGRELLSERREELVAMGAAGWIEVTAGRLCLTEEGTLVANGVIERLV